MALLIFVFYTVCDDGTYGDNCTENCTCDESNTVQCNHTSGTCLCKSGWEGDKCQTDINECQPEPNDCPVNSTCNNKNGTHDCDCNTGFIKTAANLCQSKFTHSFWTLVLTVVLEDICLFGISKCMIIKIESASVFSECDLIIIHCKKQVVIPPTNKFWGVYRNHPVRPPICTSVCPSVCPTVCLSICLVSATPP